jgi:Carboxypeptidase regulatory-like domain/TonB dependent receptor
MKCSCKLLLGAFAFALVLWCLPQANAQVLYGSVVGVVTDPSGSAIPNANILLTNRGTAQTYEEKTDEAGRISIVNIQPGEYDLKVTATGFRTYTRTDLIITANTVARAEVKMEVGALSEQVTVTSDATMLQTDKSDTHTELTTKEVANLPLPGYRNYQTLVNLVPGATPAGFQNSPTDTPNRALTTNINGTNRNNNTTKIDGAASVNLWLPHHAGYIVPEEMVDTVNITTSAADAEQGMAGGAAMTVVTKSGTNEFHGSVFEFHDNQHLKANNFFQQAGTNQPLSIYNNYGTTVGGPILKNKLFFFFSWDGTRQRQGGVYTASVPTADIKNGDFSAYSTVIYDPNTGNADGSGRTPFPNNKIDPSRFSIPATKIQAYYPLPNQGGQGNNYFTSAVPLFNRDYIDAKVNWNPSDKHAIWGKYGHMSALVGGNGIFGIAGGPAPGSDPGLGDTKINNGSLGHTYTFTPTLLLDGVIGYQRMEQTVKGNDFGTNYGTQLGIPGLNGPDIRQSGFPNVSINGYEGMGVPGWMPLFRTEESFNMSHNVTWSKGAHELRFGFDGVLHRMTHWQPELGAGPRGYLEFDGGLTSLGPNGAGNNLNGYADFLLGLPQNMQKSIQYILMTPREWQFGWYARDRWQVNRKLTVNLGVRYEFYPLMTRAGGKGIERLDPATNLVYMGGRGDVPVDVGVTVNHKMFSPRLGVAYRLDEKTVIRAGYGLNWDPLPFSRPLRGFYPLTVNFNFTPSNPYAPVRSLEQGMPPVFGPDISTGVVELPAVADMRTPYKGLIHRGYTQSWNLTVERRLPQDMVVTAAYVGTQSTHLLADLNINTDGPGQGVPGLPYYQLLGRQISTNMWDGYLSSNYHSLQMSLNKRFSKGLLLKGAYTWSKALDMTDDDGWAGVSWNWSGAFRRNYAPAGFDRRQVLQMAWVYDLPVGKGRQWINSGPAQYIVGGWQVNGVVSAYTGTPFTVGAPGGSLNSPGNTQTADQVNPVVAQPGLIGSAGTYYDPTAFAAVTDVRFGTSGRNLLRSPGVWNTDLSINRTFPIKERINLTFRTEIFNLPNTSHFNGPNTDVVSQNFMRIYSAFGERQIRFGLRLGF